MVTIGNFSHQLPKSKGVFTAGSQAVIQKRFNQCTSGVVAYDIGKPTPYVAIAHVVLETTQMAESGKFVRAIGMRPISEGTMVSVYEMRGGTHLILMQKERVTPGDAPFDLMVDDLHHAHKQFTALGLTPSPIEARP